MDQFRGVSLNKTLVVLAGVAAVLGVISYFVIFYGGGTYVVTSPLSGNTGSGRGTSTSTASSTLGLGGSTSTASSTSGTSTSTSSSTGQLALYSSTFTTSPMTWKEGYDTLSITGASLSGSQLTLAIDVQMGAVAECVPMNLRLITNEQGDLATPITASFSFGENSTCIGMPGGEYKNQQVVFTVDPTSMPLSFITGGTANQYFELSTTPSGGIVINKPPTQG